ncbi:MAG TPA: hypothetical protein VK390_15325 [Propionibacteriaceae bacterium]|nr:hypothetical protein [Propionibacteriaceae bacterium]
MTSLLLATPSDQVPLAADSKVRAVPPPAAFRRHALGPRRTLGVRRRFPSRRARRRVHGSHGYQQAHLVEDALEVRRAEREVGDHQARELQIVRLSAQLHADVGPTPSTTRPALSHSWSELGSSRVAVDL